MTELSPAMRIMRMHIESAADGNQALLRLLELSVGRVIGKNVVVREHIEIEDFRSSVWRFPVDAARRYLENRQAFPNIEAACRHFGGHLVSSFS